MVGLAPGAPTTSTPTGGGSPSYDVTLSVADLGVRGVNAALRALPPGARALVVEPDGAHNLAVGLDAAVTVDIDGTVGYYPGGLGKQATVTVRGTAATGVGENLMSGTVRVTGRASASVGASAHGGLVVVHGDAGLRAGISLKGGTVAIGGDAGAFCGFLAQAGTILVCGDAGESIGDSLYEAVVYVGGRVGSLGSDATVEDLTDADVAALHALVTDTGFDHLDVANVTKVVSAKQLYHFATHNAGAY